MRLIKASEIVQDFSFYPRVGGVDWQNVDSLVLAIEAKSELPPIVVCACSRRVVDGFHRLNALMRVHGPDVEVNCIEKQYDDVRQMLLDAIRYNAKHGAQLREADRKHCVALATQFSANPADIATAFGISASVIGALSVARNASTLEVAVPRRREEQTPERDIASRLPPTGRNAAASPSAVCEAERGVIRAAVKWHVATEDDFEVAMDELTKAVEAYLDLTKPRQEQVA